MVTAHHRCTCGAVLTDGHVWPEGQTIYACHHCHRWWVQGPQGGTVHELPGW